jgi:asparagine synthetase B (glutamine-hydrolysing)
MLYLDLVDYLADDILVKVDRASMAVGLEVRCPFLDYRVIEFAWSLPLSMRISRGSGKWILREVLARYVPRDLTSGRRWGSIFRSRIGFEVPCSTKDAFGRRASCTRTADLATACHRVPKP